MMLVQGPHFKKQWSTVISKLSLLHLILLILSLSSQQPKPKRDHNSPSLKIFLWFPSHLAWKNLTTGHRALYLWFSNFSVHQNHLESLVNSTSLAPRPQLLNQQVRGLGGWRAGGSGGEFASAVSSQVTVMLPAQRPCCEKHCHEAAPPLLPWAPVKEQILGSTPTWRAWLSRGGPGLSFVNTYLMVLIFGEIWKCDLKTTGTEEGDPQSYVRKINIWGWSFGVARGLLITFFWLCCIACRILVLWPGIKFVCPAVELQSPNCWTTRVVLIYIYIFSVEIDIFIKKC